MQSVMVVGLGAALLAACGGGDVPAASGVPTQTALSASAALGEKIFSDASLSASGRLACASCHSPAAGHAPDNALAVQLGGRLLDQPGSRVAASLNYLSSNGAFHFDAEGVPTGGFFWDGRAASLQAQARAPLLAAHEMANANVDEVVDKLSRAAYADEFMRVFGADIFSRPERAVANLTLALQRYQLEDPAFRAFSSKYDAFLRGQAVLTAQEARGRALFDDPTKGNCAGCHSSVPGADGSPPLFTDFSYDNLGVPRNPALAHNGDPGFFDLGLCARADLAHRTDLCGAFKVPSLRNVALRKVLFHNGRFTSLKDVVTFYVTRDTHPERWYPRNPDGTVKKFDDLPAPYHANVNPSEVPYDRRPGDAPALTDSEVDAVVTFLTTLTDGYGR